MRILRAHLRALSAGEWRRDAPLLFPPPLSLFAFCHSARNDWLARWEHATHPPRHSLGPHCGTKPTSRPPGRTARTAQHSLSEERTAEQRGAAGWCGAPCQRTRPMEGKETGIDVRKEGPHPHHACMHARSALSIIPPQPTSVPAVSSAIALAGALLRCCCCCSSSIIGSVLAVGEGRARRRSFLSVCSLQFGGFPGLAPQPQPPTPPPARLHRQAQHPRDAVPCHSSQREPLPRNGRPHISNLHTPPPERRPGGQVAGDISAAAAAHVSPHTAKAQRTASHRGRAQPDAGTPMYLLWSGQHTVSNVQPRRQTQSAAGETEGEKAMPCRKACARAVVSTNLRTYLSSSLSYASAPAGPRGPATDTRRPPPHAHTQKKVPSDGRAPPRGRTRDAKDGRQRAAEAPSSCMRVGAFWGGVAPTGRRGGREGPHLRSRVERACVRAVRRTSRANAARGGEGLG